MNRCWPNLIRCGLLFWAAVGVLRSQEDAGASSEESGNGEAKRRAAYFHYALFFIPEPSASVGKAAERLLGGTFHDAFRPAGQAAEAEEGLFLHVRMLPTEEYSAPPAAFLRQKGVGLSEEAITSIGSSREVCLLEFLVVEPKNYEYLSRADRFAAELAKATGACVWDEETRQMFSADSWIARRVEEQDRPLVARHVVVHGSEMDTGTFRAVTLGLKKLGYPDYALEDVSAQWWEPMGKLLEFLIAEASRRGPFDPAQGYYGAQLREAFGLPEGAVAPGLAFRDVDPLEGDPGNKVWGVDFSTYPGRSPEERQRFLVEHLLAPDPATAALRARQEELLALSDEARKRLQEKRAAFEAGLPGGERLLIKARIDDEYRWVEVRGWDDEGLRGVLEDEPGRKAARAKGSGAAVALEEVFDYLHLRADGTREGDETGRLIRSIEAANPPQSSGQEK